MRQVEIIELHEDLAQRVKEGEREGGKREKEGKRSEIYFHLV